MWVADEVLCAEVVDEGGRKGIRLTKPCGDSTIIQTIYLPALPIPIIHAPL